ncbi:DUF3644 domain-containing protein [Erwinia aphidicola]|uniref:DUF3644 domain-containing protein n=1 Tax=Erwinia aphidicola TaxID=68334 RepID=UPI00300C28B4
MARIGKLGVLVRHLRQYEDDNSKFTANELASKTGYTVNSIRKYINEKLNGVYIFRVDAAYWRVEGLKKISNDDFYSLMSQSLKAQEETPDNKLYKNLIKRSLDAFTLALEVYNRPSLDNRVESFCILSANAWELILKAEIIKVFGIQRVFDKKGNSINVHEAISLRLQENDPVRKNLETLIELRNMSAHLLIKELQPELSRLFQSTVINYQVRYKNEMGNSPLTGQSVGMLSLVIDGPSAEISVIKDNYGILTASIVSNFLDSLNKKSSSINSVEFSIPIEYQLTLSKNKNKSDVTLSSGSDGEKAILIHVPKDPCLTHPYYEKGAIEVINQRQSLKKINMHSFRSVIKKYKVQAVSPSEHHFSIDKRHRYSESFIEWFINNLKHPDWLSNATNEYKRRK